MSLETATACNSGADGGPRRFTNKSRVLASATPANRPYIPLSGTRVFSQCVVSEVPSAYGPVLFSIPPLVKSHTLSFVVSVSSIPRDGLSFGLCAGQGLWKVPGVVISLSSTTIEATLHKGPTGWTEDLSLIERSGVISVPLGSSPFSLKALEACGRSLWFLWREGLLFVGLGRKTGVDVIFGADVAYRNATHGYCEGGSKFVTDDILCLTVSAGGPGMCAGGPRVCAGVGKENQGWNLRSASHASDRDSTGEMTPSGEAGTCTSASSQAAAAVCSSLLESMAANCIVVNGEAQALWRNSPCRYTRALAVVSPSLPDPPLWLDYLTCGKLHYSEPLSDCMKRMAVSCAYRVAWKVVATSCCGESLSLPLLVYWLRFVFKAGDVAPMIVSASSLATASSVKLFILATSSYVEKLARSPIVVAPFTEGGVKFVVCRGSPAGTSLKGIDE